MQATKSFLRKSFKFLASAKFAVIILLALAFISAWGTIVESRYNTETAQKLVYFSPYMRVIMVCLIISLTFSAIDRWPWKKRHVDFLIVHLGIITLIVGAYITQRWGIDGSVSFSINESVDYALISETELYVYASTDGDNYFPYYREEVDFMKNRPEKSPLTFEIEKDKFRISEYMPYALEKREVVPVNETREGPAVRFQLQNAMVNVTEWISAGRMTADYKLGPAQILLGPQKPEPTGGNEILLWPAGKDALNYEVLSKKDGARSKRGTIKAGGEVETGWMGLKFRVINYYPHARSESVYERLERPTPISTSAIKVEMNDKAHWLGVNSRLKLFKENGVYIVTYGSRIIPLGFSLKLKKFDIGRDPGGMRAASYKSTVDVEGLGEVEISMNEPLKHKGYTFYQASFAQDEMGQASASVLSVNWDPGRWVKYIGSLCIVIGTTLMFYMRGRPGRKPVA